MPPWGHDVIHKTGSTQDIAAGPSHAYKYSDIQREFGKVCFVVREI